MSRGIERRRGGYHNGGVAAEAGGAILARERWLTCGHFATSFFRHATELRWQGLVGRGSY